MGNLPSLSFEKTVTPSTSMSNTPLKLGTPTKSAFG